MTQVSPPFLIKKLRPREGLARVLGVETGSDFNNYLDQLERFLEQSYRRIGGSGDISEEVAEANAIDIAILRAREPEDPADDTHVLRAQLAMALARIEDLENDQPTVDLNHILSRLDDLEAQQ